MERRCRHALKGEAAAGGAKNQKGMREDRSCSMAKCCQEEAERENEAHRREG